MAQYIDKSALVAEIRSLQLCTMDEHMSFYSAEAKRQYDVLSDLKSFLDTLEVKEMQEPTASDRGMVEEIIINLKRVEQDYHIDLTREVEWVRNLMKKGEPVSRTPADVESAMQEVEEKSMAFTEAHQGENTDTILAQMRGEEPVNNDLEEAASLYVADDALKPWQTIVKEAFKGGAKWKKKKMMKDAVKTEVCERITQNGLLPSVTVLVNEFKPGDKVKLIIIKDE